MAAQCLYLVGYELQQLQRPRLGGSASQMLTFGPWTWSTWGQGSQWTLNLLLIALLYNGRPESRGCKQAAACWNVRV